MIGDVGTRHRQLKPVVNSTTSRNSQQKCSDPLGRQSMPSRKSLCWARFRARSRTSVCTLTIVESAMFLRAKPLLKHDCTARSFTRFKAKLDWKNPIMIQQIISIGRFAARSMCAICKGKTLDISTQVLMHHVGFLGAAIEEYCKSCRRQQQLGGYHVICTDRPCAIWSES